MGFRVREFRLKAGMSQEELAEKSHVSRTTIWAIENGTKASVLTGTLLALANALGTTIDEIFYDDTVKS